MVKIPELAEDGQNWKIYRAKFLEVAATFDCLEVLAGRPYEGEDWDGCNALLCCMFMETVAPSIYFKIRRRTAHKNFKYLAKRFHDNDPIPHANELQHAGTATAVEMPENYPTSMNAATERHAHTKSDEEDLTTTTQDLTRGTQDVDDGNVGSQDPCTSLEASVQGTSAKCIEMTPVVLESMPHELQDWPQDSLQATPYACEQEVADSIVTAGHTNSTAKMAKPNVVDVDRKAALGRDLAERVHIVDEGDKMECDGELQLQQTYFYCEESCQHDGNTNGDVPSAHGLLLKGEWTGYASSRLENLSEGCKRGMSERESVDEADGDPGRAAEHGDAPNELMELLTTMVEPYVEDGDTSVHVCLGGTSMRMGDTNGPGSQADGSRGQTDESKGLADGSRGWTDTLNMSNSTEIACISHNDDLDTYLGAAGTKRPIHETDGIRNHADAPIRCRDTPSIETETETAENERGNVRMGQIGSRT